MNEQKIYDFYPLGSTISYEKNGNKIQSLGSYVRWSSQDKKSRDEIFINGMDGVKIDDILEIIEDTNCFYVLFNSNTFEVYFMLKEENGYAEIYTGFFADLKRIPECD